MDLEAGAQSRSDEHALAHVKSATPVIDDERASSLATGRFLVQVTIERSTREKLRHAQALLSHVVTSGDVAEVLDRALDALIEKLETRKLGSATRGRRSKAWAGGTKHSTGEGRTTSRYIPAHVRRAVWERDRGRCTFMSTSGHRCGERRLLQFDHVEPVARGGTACVEGLRLRCRAHNQLEAERVFGREFMRRRQGEARRGVTPKRARPRDTAADDLTQDVLAGLRGLGCRGEEARRAALFSSSLENGTLEDRMRAALGFISRRSVPAVSAAGT